MQGSRGEGLCARGMRVDQGDLHLPMGRVKQCGFFKPNVGVSW